MSVHGGHRERMKERFLCEGLRSFSPHEVVELMLYYAVPRKDVNETAHLLIERFGSLAGLLEASIDEIREVPGVGDHAATLFKLLCAVSQRYVTERETAEYRYDSLAKIGRYLVGLYIGETVEKIYLLLFDNGMKLLNVVAVGDGVVNSANVQPRTIIEKTLSHKAANVVLAHNHPGGLAQPSAADIEWTAGLRTILSGCDIRLLEHYVVAGNSYNVIINTDKKAEIALETERLSHGIKSGETVSADADLGIKVEFDFK